MNKLNVESIVVNKKNNIKELFKEYETLKIAIKDSNKKIIQLKSFISDSIFKEYNYLKKINSDDLNSFLLDNPLLSEYIDENNYNITLNDKLDNLLTKSVDFSKLNNGINCHHEFIKLNGKLVCTKCFIKEEELDFTDDNFQSFLIDGLTKQMMYIDEVEESELATLETAKNAHKELINSLYEKKEYFSENDKLNIDETISKLQENRVLEYRNYLKNQEKGNTFIKTFHNKYGEFYYE